MPDGPRRTLYERSEMAALAAVVAHGGFSAAARTLRTAPGTLSRRVRRLERSLGTRLIATAGQQTVVTAHGTLVAEAAERIAAVLSPYPARLQLQHLETLATVHRSGSITAAAQELSLPQPALSRLLRRVENLLGTDVFVRGGTGVTATPAGLDVLQLLPRLHGEQDLLQQRLSRATSHGGPSGVEPLAEVVDTGDLPPRLTIAVAALPAGRLVAYLSEAVPGVQWQMQPFDRAGSLEDIRRRRLDLAVWFRLSHELLAPVAGLHSIPLLDEPVWLAVAPGNPLAARDEVTLAELAGHGWISRPHGPLRRLLDEACRAAGFTPRLEHVSENNRAIRALVAADLGITLASPAIPESSDVTVVPLTGVPDLHYHLTYNVDHLHGSQAHRIATAIQNWYRADIPRSPRYHNWSLDHRRHTALLGPTGVMPRPTAPDRASGLPSAHPAGAPGAPLPARIRLSAASLPAVRMLEALTTACPDTLWDHEPFDHTTSLAKVGTGELDLVIAFDVLHEDPVRTATPPTAEVVVHGSRLPTLHLVDEPVWLAAGPRTAWARHTEVSLARLATETWIARSTGPLRRLFDDACRRAGFTPRDLRVIDNNWPIRGLVVAGEAVTLCAATVAGEDIAVVPLLDAPHLRYRLVWSPQHLTDDQAHRIHRTLLTWYRTEAQRSRRYWSHILSHPDRFPGLPLPPTAPTAP